MKTFLVKTILVSTLAGWLGGSLIAQTADQDVANGRNYLTVHDTPDLVLANQQFTNALVLSPTNESANALVALTRLLLLPTMPAGSNFLNSLKFSIGGRNLYNWTSSLPVSVTSGQTLLPTNNTAMMIAFYRTNIMAALAASRTNLALITDPNFTLSLTAEETSMDAVTVDYGDILMLQALERVAEFAGYTANAQNGNVVLSQLQALGNTNGVTFQKVLSLYPSLLTLSSASDLAASEGALTNAIARYFAASDFIRNVRPPGAPALFVLSADETNDEALFRTELTNFLSSLAGPAQFTAPDPVTINASNYFSGAKTLRSLLPQFNGDSYVNGTLPDYTFGGILVDEPAYLVEKQLRHMFHSYAGIYVGDGGLYDSDYNINNGNGGYGDFAVFVGTNQQATLIGTDNGDGSDDGTDFGVILQFSVDKHGNWQFNSNNISAYGSIDKDGWFWGEMDVYTNDSVFSVYFYAYQQSAYGPFQTAAGYYSGTIQGGTSEKLNGILASDGEVYFCPTLPSGTPDTGGSAQFDANNHFITTIVSATVIAGTLNPNTLVISGTFTNTHTGTWTLTRSAKVPFDVPPAITKNLPLTLPAPLGTNLTLSLVATGSPPMCYQWFFNSVAIPNATTNTLAIGNVQYSAAGAYSVTIDNVAGETNAAVTLTVVRETVRPTNQITAPTSGQQVSNALYTVTGKAGDNVAVSNVLVQVNNGGWNPATSANQWANWTLQVPLLAGSNTVQAYAVDTSGNVSMPTNTVIFKYVVSAPLTVQLTGKGTISPNDSNAVLQVGTTYSLKAAVVAGSGFAFTSWTGGTSRPLAWLTNGTTVQFVMAQNLVLQANFADTNRPTLTITAPTAGRHMTNALALVTGTAADNWQVAGVWCQLNSNSWAMATSTNGWTNWTTLFKLAAGTNTVRAYAADLGGNLSLTNSVSVLSSNAFMLWLSVTNGQPLPGNGLVFNLQLSPGLNGHIQVSTNLADWTAWTNFVGTNPAASFRDPAATNGLRFYRAVVP